MGDADKPTLDQVNVVVSDMPASVAFYRALGLDIPDRDPSWDPHHRSAVTEGGGDFDLDSSAFAPQWCSGFSNERTGPVIGFRVASRDAVDATHDKLTALGHRSLQAPRDMFWGARYALVEDPDGNAVGLMSPVDPKRRTAPPDPAALG
ncbi:MAG: VOC family protein [Myxococcales bacterium]|nr:VOC family protein [Myxococcales bacterium]MDD9965176.1 VOC family protein [Myxococcales bacterium]